MSEAVYSQESIDCNDLIHLRDFAYSFLCNYRYTKNFQDLLLAITLCQGSANHYVVSQGYAKRYFDSNRNGVKDFDVWFFFKEAENRSFNNRWLQSRDLGKTKFGKNPDDIGYMGRRVDFLGRSIPYKDMSVAESIQRWISFGGGASPGLIARKAVVGLYPDDVFGRCIWVNPRLT